MPGLIYITLDFYLMMILIGMVIVIVCVIVGYVGCGGHLQVLWQPLEFLIIGGSGIGAFIIANPKSVLSKTGGALGCAFKGQAFSKKDFLDLLSLLFTVFKLAKSKGMLELETHIENPKDSSVFSGFPSFLHHHHAVTFFCDYMRMITMGSENPHQLEDLMNEELDIHHQESHQMVSAFQNMGDSFPALGIVAAVLGVIHTMGSINQPPEILGKLIGGALVGTFMGILMSYGFVGPIANVMKAFYDGEAKYYQCMKAGILAYVNGYAPAIAVEFARKSIDSHVRPTFYELETAISELLG